jgi:hypothetical protein
MQVVANFFFTVIFVVLFIAVIDPLISRAPRLTFLFYFDAHPHIYSEVLSKVIFKN